MAAEHFNCVHIPLDNLVEESDSKSANKVFNFINILFYSLLYFYVGTFSGNKIL